MKDEFISAVSHELRTPLTSIRGALALVMSGSAGELPAKAKELLSIALRNSERLVHIVNDILDAEKIESGKMRINMQKVPLAPFLEQTLAYNQPYAEKFNVRFKLNAVPLQMHVEADPDRLMQVITNLLSNAAKFSPPESEIEVSTRKSGGMIVIEVRDHGPGIPAEFQPHIFQKFAQARDSGSRRNEGAGLGLNLSRQLTELMHGKIGFDTKAGQGTTFFVQLKPDAEALHSEVA
jgi:signal transduction histidine kinase